MKTIGKIAVLGMALALALVLAACGGSSSSGSASASSASGSGSASAASSESASGSASAASSASASSASSSASASSAASSAAATAFKGTVSGDAYTNEFFGVKYTLPSGFTFFDEAMMAKQNGTTYTDDELQAALEKGVEYYDAAAASSDGTSTVSVSVVYASTPEYQALDEKGFAEAMASAGASQLEAAGATIKDSVAGAYTNGETGDEFAAVKRTVEKDGKVFYQEILVKKSGDYFMAVSATSVDEKALDEVLCNFSLL